MGTIGRPRQISRSVRMAIQRFAVTTRQCFLNKGQTTVINLAITVSQVGWCSEVRVNYRIHVPNHDRRIFRASRQLQTIWREFTKPNFVAMIIQHLNGFARELLSVRINKLYSWNSDLTQLYFFFYFKKWDARWFVRI